MSEKLMSVSVKGKEKLWSFNFYGDEKYINDWVSDGLDIDIIENVIPMWVVDVGLTRPWCFVQDMFNFKNPFKS